MDAMQNMFLQVLNMSITASYIIVFVVIVRLLLRKAPKSISYLLWGIVLFRLVCPISFNSEINFLQSVGVSSTEYIPPNISVMEQPVINTGISPINQAINQSLPKTALYGSSKPMQTLESIACLVWIAGMIALLAYSIISYILFQRKLKTAKYIKNNIYESDNILTAFVIGFIKPRIYLPVGLTEREHIYILEHEKTHIKRLDHLLKPIAFFVLCIHWFNPLVWLAFVLMSKDMEMSCDERVIKKIGDNYKKDYSYSLLSMAQNKKIMNGSPLAFGEKNTKTRIKNILNYKKPTIWFVTVLVIAVAGISLFLLGNPDSSKKDEAVEIENLGVSITIPASWKGKYSIVYDLPGADTSDYVMVMRDNSGGGGILFWIDRLEGDLIEAKYTETMSGPNYYNVFPGFVEMYTFNGYTYIFSQPTDVQAPVEMGEEAVAEYNEMVKDLPMIFESITPVSNQHPIAQNEDFKFIGTSMFTVEVPEQYDVVNDPNYPLKWQINIGDQNVGWIDMIPFDTGDGYKEIEEERKKAVLVNSEWRVAVSIIVDNISEDEFNKITNSFSFRRLEDFNGIDYLSEMNLYESLGGQRLFGDIDSFTFEDGNLATISINEKIFHTDETQPNGFYIEDVNSTVEYPIDPFINIYPLAPPNYNYFDPYYMPMLRDLLETGGTLKLPYNQHFYEFIYYEGEITHIMGRYVP